MATIRDAEYLAAQMQLSKEHFDVQVAQTYLRMQLVEGWQIPQGAGILEIGCGQGDMTATLAHAVGGSGHVTAVDIASPHYGAPVSIGQSADHLKTTPIGDRIDFRFQCDLMDPSISFTENEFDYVVLAHCSWYFGSSEQLRKMLLRIHPWARYLCYSEWNMEPYALDQIAHMLAVLIQGQVEAYKFDTTSNIRTPLSKTRFKQILQQTGWRVLSESAVDSGQLKDADWEVESCIKSSIKDAEASGMPPKLVEFIHSQIDILHSMAARGENRSLFSYSILAEKSLDSASDAQDR
jgi:SAM-dependent methyltransferase